MQRLKQRSAEEGVAHHSHLGVRVYADDNVQSIRIRHARNFTKRAISTLGDSPLRIVELGCGTADISGIYSDAHSVSGFDCNEAAILHARERFPAGSFETADIIQLTPFPCDILILCELLEHISDPETFLSRWLPLAKSAVISHPIDGDILGDLSGGDHCWSYSDSDFARWPSLGNHAYTDSIDFQMSGYRIKIGLSSLLVTR